MSIRVCLNDQKRSFLVHRKTAGPFSSWIHEVRIYFLISLDTKMEWKFANYSRAKAL